METYINGISYYLPKNTLSNDDIHKVHPEWDAEKISKKTGIKNRYIASKNECSSDMAVNAAKILFEEYGIDRNEIDFLIFCTQSPDYVLPTSACIIQERLNLPTSIGAFDFNLGCSGYVYGLSIAKGFISSGIAKKILFLTANTYSKYIHPKDKSNKTIFGDAATATILSSENTGLWQVGNFVFGTDGKGAENLIVKNSGIKFNSEMNKDILDNDKNFIKNDSNLYMNGGEIFSFSSSAVPKLISEVLQNNKLTLESTDAFVFHQANRYMLDYIRRKINIEQNKFIIHIENVGNTVSNTIPIALKEKCINSNYQNIILAGFGVGYSWSGCVLKRK